MSFSNLRNRSANKDKLLEKLKGGDTQYQDSDNRYWKLTTDKLGVGSAVIRFLPPSEGEDEPYVKIFDHGFQGPTGLYYIEKSLTTIGQPDPLGELNRETWALDTEEAKETVRKRKRRLKYVSNIYVVDDPAKPENNGKVFLFSYGVKIFEKIKALLEDDNVDAFDLWEGANFRLKAKRVEKFPNYDGSNFAAPGPLDKDDEKLEMIWKQQYKLKELLDPSNFKTYDQLKAQLDRVLGNRSAASQADAIDRVRETRTATDEPAREYTRQESKASTKDDDDDDMSWFDKFKEDDEAPF